MDENPYEPPRVSSDARVSKVAGFSVKRILLGLLLLAAVAVTIGLLDWLDYVWVVRDW